MVRSQSTKERGGHTSRRDNRDFPTQGLTPNPATIITQKVNAPLGNLLTKSTTDSSSTASLNATSTTTPIRSRGEAHP